MGTARGRSRNSSKGVPRLLARLSACVLASWAQPSASWRPRGFPQRRASLGLRPASGTQPPGPRWPAWAALASHTCHDFGLVERCRPEPARTHVAAPTLSAGLRPELAFVALRVQPAHRLLLVVGHSLAVPPRRAPLQAGVAAEGTVHGRWGRRAAAVEEAVEVVIPPVAVSHGGNACECTTTRSCDVERRQHSADVTLQRCTC